MSQRLEASGENVWIKALEYNFLDIKYSRSLKPSALIWEYEKVQKIPDSLITPNDRWDILLKYKNAFQETAKNGINISYQTELDTILSSDIVPENQKEGLRKALQDGLLSFAQDSGIRKFEAQLVMNKDGVYTINPGRTVNQTDTLIAVNLRDTPNRDKMVANVENKNNADRIVALEAQVASLKGWQEIVSSMTQSRNRITNASREAQAKVNLPINDWQRILVSPKEAQDLAELIQNCDLRDKCMNSNVLDVALLQKKVEAYKPLNYTGKKWDDGLLGPATFIATKEYVKNI